ncbi:hypothetical protein ABW20_dc0104030 [Dactylellina cionopaga]|nr:hypothetical protein ABW20_dc0104030 [Dactylellina cionopaga]
MVSAKILSFAMAAALLSFQTYAAPVQNLVARGPPTPEQLNPTPIAPTRPMPPGALPAGIDTSVTPPGDLAKSRAEINREASDRDLINAGFNPKDMIVNNKMPAEGSWSMVTPPVDRGLCTGCKNHP